MHEDAAALLEATQRLFARHVTPGVIAAIEAGGETSELWRKLVASGVIAAPLPEAAGGLGLSWGAFFPLAAAAGEYGVPLPLIESALLRALRPELPEAPIAIAAFLQKPSAQAAAEGAARLALRVPFAGVARWLAVEIAGEARLFALADAVQRRHGLDADVVLDGPGEALGAGLALREIGALAQAARIAGALRRVLAMSIEYALERRQFGRRLADFQAVQHHLAELASAVQLASLAAEAGFAAGPPEPGALIVALAKARCSALATRGAMIAHAVHGAMGIAAEFPLQIFTRALHAARLAHGSEAIWHEAIGTALLASGQEAGAFCITALTPASG